MAVNSERALTLKDSLVGKCEWLGRS